MGRRKAWRCERKELSIWAAMMIGTVDPSVNEDGERHREKGLIVNNRVNWKARSAMSTRTD